jgi:hypothetical protein
MLNNTLTIANENVVLSTLSKTDILDFIDYLEAEVDCTCTASAYGLETIKRLESKINILKGLTVC